MKPLSRNKRGLKDGSPVVKAMRRWAIKQDKPFTVKQIMENMTFSSGKPVKDSRAYSHSEHTLYCYLKRNKEYEVVRQRVSNINKPYTFRWVGE
tara:strand:- start:197 stop:478 length:282 start_codon:yes stop_codon:yes gene_type:complete